VWGDAGGSTDEEWPEARSPFTLKDVDWGEDEARGPCCRPSPPLIARRAAWACTSAPPAPRRQPRGPPGLSCTLLQPTRPLRVAPRDGRAAGRHTAAGLRSLQSARLVG
jgi:hypothetical protein